MLQTHSFHLLLEFSISSSTNAFTRDSSAREKRHWLQMATGKKLPAELCQEDVLNDAAVLLTAFSQEASIKTKEHARTVLRGSTILTGLSEPKLNLLMALFRDMYPGDSYVNGVSPDLLGAYLLVAGADGA